MMQLNIEVSEPVKATAEAEFLRLFRAMFGEAPSNATVTLSSDGIAPGPSVHDAIAITLDHGNLTIHGNTNVALIIGIYRFFYEFGARYPQPGENREIIPSHGIDEFINGTLKVEETASQVHRGVCIEGADSIENILDFITWMPKVGFNAFFVQFENPYPFLKRWYEHEFNPYAEVEEFDTDIAQRMSDEVDRCMAERGIIQHRVGHGWTGEVLGYSSKYGWEKGIKLPKDKEPLVAEIKGKRELIDGAPILTSLDFANPEVIPQMVELVVDYAKKRPDVDYLHVWLSDADNNICECDECKKELVSDQYVRFLNDLDERLTEEGLDTRICFLLYHELLFAPEHEVIKHPDRFTMMFAPITRTFEKSYADVDYEHGVPEPEPYVRNDYTMPNSLEENLAYLFAWQKTFKGDSFVYDYPLGRAHYGDFGYMKIAHTIARDIQYLDRLGLNGYVSCQELRVGTPTFFPNYVMGRMLWDSKLDYDALVEEYFETLFGADWKQVVDYLSQMSTLSSCDYFNAIGERLDPDMARRYDEIVAMADEFLPVIEQHIADSTGVVKSYWLGLSHHRQYVMKLAAALHEIAVGNEEKAQHLWHDFLDFIRRNEPLTQPNLDVYRVIEVAKNYAGFKL
ncbi:hypothetical protein D2E26_0748 [Bifidobacterium dolichotidis]|uniref:DUF4838 domain-containing protein n=1 Tax=Bifidobacterium dolichotidis TaxID=2306976 RepID=A0A430FTQ3_9BIFI|nr:DUF4838 domain-containing protein [Bifidobacterium dolichotidis]RSX56185.1 hypothetical protein D2E26_0748 [Bifidobacterium dolichotidis]